MTGTTHADFNADTTALEVATAFPDRIKGKTILITGVNRGGIGYTTAEALASQSPARLILTGRSKAKPSECAEELKSKFPSVDYRILELNLSSQASVKAAAAEVLSWSDVPKIDLLINNAGVMAIPERTLSPEGIEMHFATNHIGHFLFTNLIMPKLIAAAKGVPKGSVRVVSVASIALFSGGIRFSDVNFTKPQTELPESERHDVGAAQRLALGRTIDPATEIYNMAWAYGQSKSANALFGVGLTSRLYEKHGILSISLHPGGIDTELGRTMDPRILEGMMAAVKAGHLKLKTREAGASTSMVAALDPALGPSEVKDGKEGYGAYLSDCQIAIAPKHAVGSEEAKRLWELSEDFVGQKFND